MFKRLYVFVFCFISFNVSAVSDNPFAKHDVLTVGKEVSWDIDKKAVEATKTASDDGTYYHLKFDNKQLSLSITKDSAGTQSKSFKQLEVKDVTIDGKQSALFGWCLNNQERHNRFLQQGLQVKNGICTIDGSAGTFIIKLDKDTLLALQKASRLTIMLKPFRTPLELKYDLGDFSDMYIALNAKPAPVAAVVAPAATVQPKKTCWAGAPPEYKSIKSVGYTCSDASSKIKAETQITKLVNQEKEKQRKLAAEKEKQRKLAEEQKKKELAAKLKEEERLQAEAAAIAASKAKQAQLDSEITQKMVNVCEKYWNKGEHRCYCEKYIKYAPASIQASSTCK